MPTAETPSSRARPPGPRPGWPAKLSGPMNSRIGASESGAGSGIARVSNRSRRGSTIRSRPSGTWRSTRDPGSGHPLRQDEVALRRIGIRPPRVPGPSAAQVVTATGFTPRRYQRGTPARPDAADGLASPRLSRREGSQRRRRPSPVRQARTDRQGRSAAGHRARHRAHRSALRRRCSPTSSSTTSASRRPTCISASARAATACRPARCSARSTRSSTSTHPTGCSSTATPTRRSPAPVSAVKLHYPFAHLEAGPALVQPAHARGAQPGAHRPRRRPAASHRPRSPWATSPTRGSPTARCWSATS